MKVPLLDLAPQHAPIRKELEEAVLRVVDSTGYILGPDVVGLEKEIADYCGTRHAIGVSSGSDALLVALMALDVGPGDVVITTTYSFFASAGCISRLNATPAFLDIDPVSFNMRPDALAAWLEDPPVERERVKAIIPVHLYGQCADLDPILEIGRTYDIPVIEDAAQAIGSSYASSFGNENGEKVVRKAGSMALCGCYSFFPSKNLGCLGDGGMVVTNDDAFADRVRRLRVHGGHEKYYYDEVGGNFRIDTLQAAVLRVKLPHLDGWAAGRRRNAEYYDEHLQVSGLVKPTAVWGREHHIYNQYVIMAPEDRDGLQAFLREREIGSAIYYPLSLHQQKCFVDALGIDNDFPRRRRRRLTQLRAAHLRRAHHRDAAIRGRHDSRILRLIKSLMKS